MGQVTYDDVCGDNRETSRNSNVNDVVNDAVICISRPIVVHPNAYLLSHTSSETVRGPVVVTRVTTHGRLARDAELTIRICSVHLIVDIEL